MVFAKNVPFCSISTFRTKLTYNFIQLANNTDMRKQIALYMILAALVFGFATTSFAAQYHIVKQGDTMWKIAQQYNVPFAEVLKLNSNYKDQNMIYPGDKIAIPSTSTSAGDEKPQVTSEPGK